MTEGLRETDAKSGSAGDWRDSVLARVRRLIGEADPEAIEEVKWRKPSNPTGVPTWSDAGMICTFERYSNKVKLTFAKGAALEDPSGLFNSSLSGGTRRAIDLEKDASLDEQAFKELIREAVNANRSSKPRR